MRIIRVRCKILIAVLLCGVSASALAEADDRQNSNRLEAWQHPWTVATMAPDGSFGVASEFYFYEAIAQAVSNCKRMSLQQLGCGAQLRAIRAGWIVALRCGNTNILGADASLAAAENAVAAGETALRENAAEPPRCIRVITVDPSGNVIRHSPDSERQGPVVSESNPD